MKHLILAILITITAHASALDVFADGYRFADNTATQRFGFTTDRYLISAGFDEQLFSLGTMHALTFTNLKMGVLTEISVGQPHDTVDYRSGEIVDNTYFHYSPFIRIGDTLQATVLYDVTNHWNIRVGFNLF